MPLTVVTLKVKTVGDIEPAKQALVVKGFLADTAGAWISDETGRDEVIIEEVEVVEFQEVKS